MIELVLLLYIQYYSYKIIKLNKHNIKILFLSKYIVKLKNILNLFFINILQIFIRGETNLIYIYADII